jgi:hypothetical protein
MLKVVAFNPKPAKTKQPRPFTPKTEVHVISNPEIVMTVEWSTEDNTAVWWMDEAAEYHCVQFPTIILKRYVAPKPQKPEPA